MKWFDNKVKTDWKLYFVNDIHNFSDGYDQNSSSSGENSSSPSQQSNIPDPDSGDVYKSDLEMFQMGYNECLREMMRALTEKVGFYPGDSGYAKLMAHMYRHFDGLCRSEFYHRNGIVRIEMVENEKFGLFWKVKFRFTLKLWFLIELTKIQN